MLRAPRRATLTDHFFPYTTLFRYARDRRRLEARRRKGRRLRLAGDRRSRPRAADPRQPVPDRCRRNRLVAALEPSFQARREKLSDVEIGQTTPPASHRWTVAQDRKSTRLNSSH